MHSSRGRNRARIARSRLACEAPRRSGATLDASGDRLNAARARNIEARRLLLIGYLEETERVLGEVDQTSLPPWLTAARELVLAGIAIRRLQMKLARSALSRAEYAAHQGGIAALTAEVENASLVLSRPAARLIARGEELLLLLDEVEALLRSGMNRIARGCGSRWGGFVSSFGRWQMWTRQSGALRWRRAEDARSLCWRRPWKMSLRRCWLFLQMVRAGSSSALALALGTGPRTVQRVLEQLARGAKVQSFGRGRAFRWMTPPVPGFPTTLLLPGPLPNE